jgi:siroheme synthase
VRIAIGNTQFATSDILTHEARSGKHVVFLVFGDVDTGSDEQAALEDSGIAVEVVPGITTSTTKVFPFMSRDNIANEILRAAS